MWLECDHGDVIITSLFLYFQKPIEDALNDVCDMMPSAIRSEVW